MNIEGERAYGRAHGRVELRVRIGDRVTAIIAQRSRKLNAVNVNYAERSLMRKGLIESWSGPLISFNRHYGSAGLIVPGWPFHKPLENYPNFAGVSNAFFLR